MSYFVKSCTLAAIVSAFALPGMAQETDAGLAQALQGADGSDSSIAAVTGWNVCSVVRTGAGWGNHYVALTCPNGPFVNKWHILSAAQKDQMLATALAAATSDNDVQVYIGGPVSGYNEIRAIYLQK